MTSAPKRVFASLAQTHKWPWKEPMGEWLLLLQRQRHISQAHL